MQRKWWGISSGIVLAVYFGVSQFNPVQGQNQVTPTQVAQITLPTQLSTLNTLQTQDKNTYTIVQHLFEGLYRLDRHQQPVPGLAERVQISDHGKQYRFRLRKNAQWSNGQQIKSTDFSYAWHRLVDPKSAAPNAYLLDAVQNAVAVREGKLPVKKLGITTPNDRELVVHLTRAQPSFLTLVSIGWLAPLQPHFVAKQGHQYASDSQHLLYTGPFTLKNWHQGSSHFTLIKNPHYWDAKAIKLQRIEGKTAEATNTGLLEFGAQQTDITRVTGQFVNQERHNTALVQHADIAVEYLDINQRKSRQLSNRNLRLAVAHAVDRRLLTSKVLRDGSQPLTGLIPRGTFQEPGTKTDFRQFSGAHQEFNLPLARQYWAKARRSLAKQPILSLTTSDDESTKIVSEYLKQQLERHLPGLKIQLHNVPKNSISGIETAGNYDLLLVGNIAATNNLDDFFSTYVPDAGFDYGAYRNQRYNRLVKQANTADANQPSRQFADYRAAEQQLLDHDAALIPLYQTASTYLVNPRLKNVQYPRYAAYFDLRDAYLE